MNKLILFFLILIGCQQPSSHVDMKASLFGDVLLAEKYVYEYTDNKEGKPNFVAANVTASDLKRVNGANKPNFACSSGFSSNKFPTENKFSLLHPAVQLEINAPAGGTVIIKRLIADLRKSANGSLQVRYALSTDKGVTWKDHGVNTVPQEGACGEGLTKEWNFDDVQITESIWFRVYGFSSSISTVVLQLINIRVEGEVMFVDADGDGYASNTDCNDEDSTVNPGAAEVCNTKDDNCNGVMNEGQAIFKYYADENKDGFIDDTLKYISTCETQMPAGYTVTPVPAGTIYLTRDTVDVNPWLRSVCMQDIGFTGGGPKLKERYVLGGKFHADIDSMGFINAAYPSGAQVDNYHSIIGDTIVYKKDGAKGSGYNWHAADFVNNPEGPPEEVNSGALVFPWQKDFWNEYVALCHSLRITADITANVQFATDEEMIWQIQHAKPAVWVGGVEQNVQGNSFRWKQGGKEYMERLNPFVHTVKELFPWVVTVVDAAPIWRGTEYFVKWNNDIAANLTDDWDGVRAYHQVGDAGDFTGRPEDDLKMIINYLDVISPQHFLDAYNKYGKRKQYIMQYHAPYEGKYPVEYRFTHMDAIYLGLEFEFFFKDAVGNRTIAYAAHWNLKQAWNQFDELQPIFKAHVMFNKFFTAGRKWLRREGIPEPLRIYGTVDTVTNNYQIAIVNTTATPMPLPYISFDGYVTNNYTAKSIHANKLLDKPIVEIPKQIDPYALIVVRR